LSIPLVLRVVDAFTQFGEGVALREAIVGQTSQPPGPIKLELATTVHPVPVLVTVTEKLPTPRPEMVWLVAPVLHRYENGPAPEGFTVIEPSDETQVVG